VKKIVENIFWVKSNVADVAMLLLLLSKISQLQRLLNDST
jgi:hypothetical protein